VPVSKNVPQAGPLLLLWPLEAKAKEKVPAFRGESGLMQEMGLVPSSTRVCGLTGSHRSRIIEPCTLSSCLTLYLLSFYLFLFLRKSDSYSRSRRVLSGRFLIFRKQ